MAVYVDNMKAQYGRLIMCHMIADTDEELREMALKIGVNVKWHQGDHFDICKTKRAAAVELGAIEITMRQAAGMRRRKEETGAMGAPGDAEAWIFNWYVEKAAARQVLPTQEAATPV